MNFLRVCWVPQEVSEARQEDWMFIRRLSSSGYHGCAGQMGATNIIMMSALSLDTLFRTAGISVKGGKAPLPEFQCEC